jgi:hypothetical protein
MSISTTDPTTPEGKAFWQRRREAEEAAERIVNTPTADEHLASDLRDLALRIDAVRYSETLSGVGQNQLYLVSKWLGEKADALVGYERPGKAATG